MHRWEASTKEINNMSVCVLVCARGCARTYLCVCVRVRVCVCLPVVGCTCMRMRMRAIYLCSDSWMEKMTPEVEAFCWMEARKVNSVLLLNICTTLSVMCSGAYTALPTSGMLQQKRQRIKGGTVLRDVAASASASPCIRGTLH